MIAAKIQVTGVTAHTVYRKVIPAGIIGAQLEFEYDMDVWSGLHKTVVFRGSGTKDVVTDASIVTIPPEVVEKPLYPLSVGVYGVDADGNLAIPTIWADLGIVRESANPSGDTSTDPSLPVWAQIKQIAYEAKQQALSIRNDADAGLFDGAQGPAGPIGPVGPQGEKGDKGDKGDPGTGGVSAWSEITDKPFNTIDGNTLVNRSGALCVNTTDDAEQDNTRPITSSGVHVICGNINALLQSI